MNSELVISIHALVKRATARLLSQIYFMRYFNPRPRKEGDLQIRSGEEAEAYFNPRPRKEGDQIYDKLTEMRAIISIHALVKRATIVC